MATLRELFLSIPFETRLKCYSREYGSPLYIDKEGWICNDWELENRVCLDENVTSTHLDDSWFAPNEAEQTCFYVAMNPFTKQVFGACSAREGYSQFVAQYTDRVDVIFIEVKES